ncbi:MAG: MerR family transcriptional regulator [Saccharothrix sp.]|nr:MerR family transcriptional regulator [Saccharothrix sp.]
MRIGELARRGGTTTRALRYYESLGLLPARRGANWQREYDEDDLKLVHEIRSLAGIGFALEDTRPFVECLRDGHTTGDACAESVEVYRRKLAELDDCITHLEAVRDQVRAQLREAEQRSEPCGR